MGMDDREPNFGEHFTIGDRFVLTGLRYDGTIETRFGPAEKSLARIVARNHADRQVTYTVLGVGVANQARRAEPSDFPRVVELVEVPTGRSGNKVRRFVRVDVDPRAFLNGDTGPPLDPTQYGNEEGFATAGQFGGADDDIPF